MTDPKTISIVMPESWHDEIKAQAQSKSESVNKTICDVLKKKFKLKEKKRSRGRPKKFQ